MSGRIESLSLEQVVARSTSIVRATGLGRGRGKTWSFRVEGALKGTSTPGELLEVLSHADHRSEEWERIRRERGVMKIMFHPSYEGTSGLSLETSKGRELILFLSGGAVLVADGALEDPAREVELRALIGGEEARDSSPPVA